VPGCHFSTVPKYYFGVLIVLATFIPRRERQIKETLNSQRKDLMNENDISYKVIGAAIELHTNSKTLKDNIHREVNNL
jgi:hypothetical protein